MLVLRMAPSHTPQAVGKFLRFRTLDPHQWFPLLGGFLPSFCQIQIVAVTYRWVMGGGVGYQVGPDPKIMSGDFKSSQNILHLCFPLLISSPALSIGVPREGKGYVAIVLPSLGTPRR